MLASRAVSPLQQYHSCQSPHWFPMHVVLPCISAFDTGLETPYLAFSTYHAIWKQPSMQSAKQMQKAITVFSVQPSNPWVSQCFPPSVSVKIITIKWEQNHLKFLAQGSPPFLKSVCIFSSWVNNCWSCGTSSSILSERKGKREEERKKGGQEGLRKKGHRVRGCEEEKNASKTFRLSMCLKEAKGYFQNDRIKAWYLRHTWKKQILPASERKTSTRQKKKTKCYEEPIYEQSCGF